MVRALLGALMLWSAMHAVFAIAATGGVIDGRALITVGVDSAAVALMGLGLGLLPLDEGRSGPIAALFAAITALVAVRGLAIGHPLLGLDAGIVLLAAALIIERHRLRLVAAVAAGVLAAVTAYSITRDLRSLTPSSSGSGLEWLYVLAAVVAAAAVALTMRHHIEQLENRGNHTGITAPAGVRDVLTGLTNRAGLDLVATPMIEHARRSGQAVHCLYLDIDGLRGVNETAGLAVGDTVLREVARIIASSVRATDVVSRWTGDELVVVGPGTGMSPLELERRVRAQVVAHPQVSVSVWSGRVSIGAATLVPWDSGGLKELISKAEQDMQMRRSLRRQAGSPRTARVSPAVGPGA